MINRQWPWSRLRQSVRLLLILLLLCSITASATAGAPLATQPVGALYLALGDSLAVGRLASLPERRGYVGQLHRLLQQVAGHTVELRNLGVSGETSATFISGGQLTAAEQALTTARQRGWQVNPITLDIGGNDLRSLDGATDAAQEAGLATFRTNLAQILDRLRAASGDRTALLLLTIYDPTGSDPQLPHSAAWWVARFNAVISEEGAKRGATMVDLAPRFTGHERELTWMPLDFHPNNAGHLAIASACWQALAYDTTPPTLTLIDLPTGPLPRPILTLKARTSDQISVSSISFTLDGQPLPAARYNRQLDLWITYWDARNAQPGAHQLVVAASDAAGNITQRTNTLTR